MRFAALMLKVLDSPAMSSAFLLARKLRAGYAVLTFGFEPRHHFRKLVEDGLALRLREAQQVIGDHAADVGGCVVPVEEIVAYTIAPVDFFLKCRVHLLQLLDT